MAWHKYWTEDGWQHSPLSPRETVRRSLHNVRSYLEDRELWHGRDWTEVFGAPVEEPDDQVFAATGQDIRRAEELEDAIVEEYDEVGKLAFESETEKDWVEYRSGLL
jgi:hypothetical protein